MSARMLRKVLQEQEQLRKSTDHEPQCQEDSDSSESPAPSRNPFDILDDQADEEEGTNEIITSDVEIKPKMTEVINSKAIRKSKKKKKTNKENSTSTKGENEVDLILKGLSISSTHSISENEPSKSEEGVGKTKGVAAKSHTNLRKPQSQSILAVDPKFLRAENELKRIFGSKVVSSFENSHSVGSSRQMHGARRGGISSRKTILISPLGDWPRWDGSLSMDFLETKDGQNFFRYMHSTSYDHAQRIFEAAKSIHDLNGIASILAYHPYHAESLLTIAEVFKFSGEHQLSADAIGKCLYALECAWHPRFNPLQGNCQLKFTYDTNKPIFTALFHHMQNLDRRGCHRSALEICKLMLSLDSDDPMGALFCIDYFALRAEEYAWLEHFADEYESDNSLWLFPNFSYSLAICRFYLEKDSTNKEMQIQSERSASIDLMKQALMLHPSVLKKLVAKAPLKDSTWTKILGNSFFGSAKSGGPTLEHLINIYVERSYIMWRFPDLQKLLEQAALLAIESVKSKDNEARDWVCMRKEAFSSEKNEYSHLLVSDFSDSVPGMPPEDLRNLMVDPRMLQAMPNEGHGLPPPEDRAPTREILNRDPLMVFLESMLPWIDYGLHEDAQNGHPNQDHEEENPQ
ncbi:hypothetical protein AMTRI_Chr06g200420 [Amborella trichopoda]|uniref:Transcription factor 25 n=1 Tax=Amborella trichopoda TaxID=13333 RepID=W1PZ07_AMBTC|nr:transcription factor 25 [Amborella trichopoda]XP_011626142.1 transcription factor 25 [Amborella trichopoda]XP_020527677.1 transcription factor 25 [Amborella trichopoda]ERN13598.1 hypothetical protein AMTR_s00049p00053430 [Amborella trichopoda]|eukprot:XP_006852131.1 transcription factor 25 [Amborella trichopoda]